MKRTLTILTAVLLAAVLSMPARALAAEESVVIQVATVDAQSGAQADVAVLLDRCAGVDSVQFDLNYDSAALVFVSMTPGDLFAAQYTIVNADEPGRVRVACASALGLSGAGTLLTLRFRVLSDTGSAVNITSGIVTRVDADYNQSEAYVSIEDGGVSVAAAALPAPSVTPWVPATPVPTPSPTPKITATPEAQEAQLQTIEQQQTTTPDGATPSILRLNPAVYSVGGGLLLAVIVLIILLSARKKKRG